MVSIARVLTAACAGLCRHSALSLPSRHTSPLAFAGTGNVSFCCIPSLCWLPLLLMFLSSSRLSARSLDVTALKKLRLSTFPLVMKCCHTRPSFLHGKAPLEFALAPPTNEQISRGLGASYSCIHITAQVLTRETFLSYR